MSLRINENLEKHIILEYTEGITQSELSKRYGVSQSTIHRVLLRYDTQSRSFHEAMWLKNPFDERFFREINTEEKAYWLGFLTGDGCIRKDPRSEHYFIGLGLKLEDRPHIEKFLRAVNAPKAHIYDYAYKDRNGGVSIIRLSSKHMFQDLINYGITPNKSLKEVPWVGSPELMHHYWRGILDSDGTVCCYTHQSHGHKFKDWYIGICGSKEICSEFKQFCSTMCGTRSKVTKARYGSECWRFGVGGAWSSLAVLDALYKNANIFLDRKYNLYLHLKEATRPKFSKFKGVSWDNQKNKWRATIKNNRCTYRLGFFEEESKAFQAYAAKALILRGYV